MIPKPLDDIEQKDIEALRDQEVAEGRALEYKEKLPGELPDDKKEFLKDVSAFANTVGGDILYGVTDDGKGVPEEIKGLAGFDADADILRLEQIVRNGTEPRIPGVRMESRGTFVDGPVLIVRVPRSWAAPHMVTFRNSSRFFARSSKGNYQMDVPEIRSAFALSEAIPDRVRRFRDDRLSRIIAGELPVPMGPRPKVILHVLPISAFAVEIRLDPEAIHSERGKLAPIRTDTIRERYNLDGLLMYDQFGEDDPICYSYCQVFRTGAIEAVNAVLISYWDKNRLPMPAIERALIASLGGYLQALKNLGISAPVFALLTLTDVQGYEIPTNTHFGRTRSTPIDREMLILPDVIVSDLDAKAADVLRPMFDALWNAAGYPRCLDYDDDGSWNPT